jgi:hypothetical protein
VVVERAEYTVAIVCAHFEVVVVWTVPLVEHFLNKVIVIIQAKADRASAFEPD